MSNTSLNAIVVALHIHSHNPVKICFCRALDVADVRNTRIVNQDPNRPALRNLFECPTDFGLIRYVTGIRQGRTTRPRDFCCNRLGILLINVENVNRGAILRKFERDCPADAAASAGNDGGFSFQPEFTRVCCQRETPRFQGMKSSWFFCSALVRTSPLAT